MCHPEERGRRAEGSFFVRNIWEALYLERCLRCRHDKQFNVFMSKHLEIVNENDKQRFGFKENQSKIRARQGHSEPVDLNL